MGDGGVRIARIDARGGAWRAALADLRDKLSPRGEVVSEQSRQRTIEVFGAPLTPRQVVERICGEVRDQGLSAVLRYGELLDKAQLTAATLRVSAEELAAAHAQADPAFLATVRRVRRNIWEFQRAVLHQDVEVRRPDGVLLRQRYLPLDRVGVCVPGGAAAYPSTVLMTVVPAQAAGVSEIALVAPPTPFGAGNPDMLAVCHELGVREVYRLGGAQAVAALAYGVEGVPKVDKIVGPGNLFVALAKKQVYGEVDIDAIAGPSEIVILADEHARPDFIAADMLAQAEHAPGASVLITWREAMLSAVADELARRAAGLAREELTLRCLSEFGALVLAETAEQACEMCDYLAPEHLHVAAEQGESLLPQLRRAGAIFVGPYTPVALGDYAAGPSHVLPTSGTARWASGLSANSFLRSNSVIAYERAALEQIADDIELLAEKEGLTAHRASVAARRAPRPPSP